MPDDVGGMPFPDGDEPDSRDHGAADEEFASLVFDEDFVRAAEIHEPSAVERMLAAAQARADAEAARARSGGGAADDESYDDGYAREGTGRDGELGPAFDDELEYGPYGRYGGALRPYRGQGRWHRPVAWLLAVLMGVGVVALAFTAVYRGAAGSRQTPAPPPTTSGADREAGSGADGGTTDNPAGRPGALPSVSADTSAPTASALPRSP
ncbi:SCO2584 family spore wall biosynthesis protein [Streptomyces sp. H27-D2]|uniref:SCO2584 family spore wall biosynthesis protein n=1 Tax=Streptomyces sp. H27-D2 TaxID=3046304 RepID=UPI002DB6081C|nr:hypothetical protein [Streptomyces sp. H27-D2]MEC4014827.1 hypothetical protein [Streptomyces sp. H27-D2]